MLLAQKLEVFFFVIINIRKVTVFSANMLRFFPDDVFSPITRRYREVFKKQKTAPSYITAFLLLFLSSQLPVNL
jgi:hypothetical protein